MAETLAKEIQAGASSMSKIRINELARELEVKPNVLLELLPELGVADKKTHSSSLDDEVALELRRRLGQGQTPEAPKETKVGAEAEAPAPPPVHHAAESERAPVVPEAITESAPREAEPQARPGAPRATHPLRPPLASGPGAASPAGILNRASIIPSRPAPPAPKPGQILSGPRQPMPPGVTDVLRTPSAIGIPASMVPGTPRPGSVPAIPTPPRPMARPGSPTLG